LNAEEGFSEWLWYCLVRADDELAEF